MGSKLPDHVFQDDPAYLGGGVSRKCTNCGLMEKNMWKKPGCKGKKKNGSAKGKHQSSIMVVPSKGATKKYGKTYGTSYKATYKSCYEDHPVLEIPDLGAIYGGSCIKPAVTDAFLYIGFDHGMSFTSRTLPWVEGEELYFNIMDMGTPKDATQMQMLVEYTIAQIKKGRKVHAGCIGGHGRTGLFFAALVAKATGMKDAIQFVRKNYCDHAVESKEQVDWLMKNYDVSEVEGYKETTAYKSKYVTYGTGASSWDYGNEWGSGNYYSGAGLKKTTPKNQEIICTTPLFNERDIWGTTADE